MKNEPSIGAANVLAALRQWLEVHSAARLARQIGVEVSTVSRWKAGQVMPWPSHVEALAAYLCLPADWRERDYSQQGGPLVHAARVREVQELVGKLDEATLLALYPALVRLFGGLE